ncbi:putative ribonuclease H-like domain-containing protein [Tanacetum coccineum]
MKLCNRGNEIYGVDEHGVLKYWYCYLDNERKSMKGDNLPFLDFLLVRYENSQGNDLIWDSRYAEWCSENSIPGTPTSIFSFDQWTIPSRNELGTTKDPRSRRFDDYKWVFDLEIDQLANEYELGIGKEGHMLDDIWEYCEKVQGDNTNWWHDHGFEDDERQKSSLDIEEYDPPKMSAHDKNGLGFGTQMDDLSNKSETISENSLTVFEVRSSDDESTIANDRTVEASTDADEEVTITAIIDGQSKTITEASLRRHLKLEDHDGITSIPNSEIFEQLALMGPKKTAWEQFSSNIATALICLATNRKYNFSRMIFEHMVTNIGSPHKFLMYPRFIQICLDMQKKQLKIHSSTYPVPSLNTKVFSNMRRLTKGYTGVEIRLFPTMLTFPTPTPSSSPSRITSSPSLSSEPSTEPTFEPQPSPDAEYHVPTPIESPLYAVHSHRSDEGSLKLIELTNLVTKLSKRIGVLEDDLKKTKQTYSSAFTKLILRIKKLESEGMIDEDPNTYYAQDDEVVYDQDTAAERQLEDSTAGIIVKTAPINISSARESFSTAGRVVYGRRSEESRKDKGKAIMTEPEPVKKSKKLLEQERQGLEEAIRLQQEVDEEEKAQIARDEEIARQLLALDEERVTTETKTTKDIDWNDPSVQKYWDKKNKPKSKAQARKNMIVYLKNQSNYKMKDFEGMSYDEIRPIFVKIWDFNHNFVPMDLEIEKEKKKPAEFQEIEIEQIEKDTTGKRKKSLPRKRTRSTTKRQKVELDDEKEDLKGYLDIVPREDVAVDVDSLSTKYPIVDWKTYTLSENFIQAFEEEKRRIASQKKAAQATSTNQLSTNRPFVSTDRSFISTDRSNTPNVSAASTSTCANAKESSFVYLGGEIPIDASTLPNADLPIDPNMHDLEDVTDTLPNDGIFNRAYDDDDDVGAVADVNNMDNTIAVSPIPTLRIHKDHPKGQILGDPSSAVQTRGRIQRASSAQQALVWILVDLPFRKKAIGTKWVFRNKRDERGIVVKNKPRLVVQGHRQEEGIDYDEVFAPVARIEAIRLFLAFASYKGFLVYQMDVKSAFLYGTIAEEVYVHQTPGFVDHAQPNKVYKVVKALYGLHQAHRAWYETLSSFLLENGFRRGTIDKTLFIKKNKSDIMLVQVYMDDIIFGSTKKSMCTEFEEDMHKRFQMSSMGELTFFLGLQVKQQPDGIFISQDKYVVDIIKKFDFCSIKIATKPIESNKPMVKDEDGVEVDVHEYRSMIGSLMYLTTSRPDIIFAVYACARFQVTPKASHLHAVKRIFRYLKHQPKLGLWYPRDSPFELEAFSDSDYAGASLDRKSTTEYVAAAHCFYHSRTKHIEIRHHFIKDCYEKRLIDVLKIHTDSNVADLLTKGFDVTRISMDLRMDRCSAGKFYSSMVYKHNMVAFLKKPNESVGFTEVVDFLKGTSLSKLQLADAIGIHNLSDAKIYAGLATLGYVTEGRYLAPTLTKKLFANMKKGCAGDIVPLLPAMLVGAAVDQGNTSGSAEASLQLKELMVLVPSLVSRVTGLETELKEIKQTLGNAVVKLVKKVKSLETALKRKSKKVLISESEESMKEKSTDFVTPTKALGEAQEEEISPTILEAAKTLRKARSMAKKIDTGLDAEEEINTGREEINTSIEEVSTGSTKVDSGTTSKRGQREGKAPMVEKDIQATHKTKEQMRQEEAGLEEAIKLQAQLDEEVAKQIHLDKMIAKIMAEEEALTEQQEKRKAQVQFEAQFYTKEDWDAIKAKLEANTELTKDNQGTWKLSQLKKLKFEEIKEEFDKYREELQTKTSKKQKIDDKDVPAIGEKVVEVKEEEPVKRKKQKARKGIKIDKSAQEDSETNKEESVEAMNPTPLDNKNLIVGTTSTQRLVSWRYYDKSEVHCLTLEACTIYMLADRKYPLSKDVCQVMLKMKLLDGKMNEVCYKLLKMIEKQAAGLDV